MSDLTETAVKNALTSKWIGHHYQYFESTGSTNDLLKKQVLTGEPDHPPAGTVVLTNYQSQGRGRLNRRWEAPPGSALLLSILLRPDWPSERLSWLTMVAGIAVVEAIESATTLSAFLKWPNDVVIRCSETWCKACGVLVEGHMSTQEHLAYAVLGIGINVNTVPELLPQGGWPSTSLAAAAGNQVSRLDLLLALLQRIEYQYEKADRGLSPRVEWNRRLITIGQLVEIDRAGQGPLLSGIAEGTAEWGQLLVRDEHGELHEVMAGDVTLRKGSA
jgi:BirA family transcriptional regulator, biotin operon repressor / biotin---[acetyl-CoA-carboxylase] ligase